MVPRRRYSRRFAAFAAAVALFFLYHVFTLQSDLQPQRQPAPSSAGRADRADPQNAGEPAPFCPPLPGIEDVLVVMKTGATESRDKVPVHFQSTLRCIPHYVIYSDFEEVIEGVQLHDVLRSMDPKVTQQIPDFDIYNRIAKLGRKGLEQDDFADEANSAIGKPNNPGWKLDKWKFLPMAQEALRYKPNAKWFVFMEADTYVSWPTLLAWLSHFDHTQPWYLGTETQIADVIFAHGGSGFMLSNPALQRASDQYDARRAELDHYTDEHWAGDCVLGKVLADAGVDLHFTWPILQNSNLGELDQFTTDLYRHPWCYIAVAFHHLNSREIEELWKFEQKRWRDKNKHILLHSDVFREYLYPEIASRPTRLNWDNLADDKQPFASTFEDCREICEAQKTCVQFSFRDSMCFTGTNPRLGSANPTAASGWLTSRIREMMDMNGICKEPEFGAG
ncbi:uncharacterized protein N7482_009643 [Penicillium canariense]|uniref:N-acetylgalactosaminide beta-1,3-galactosyltransferase n=1 Tax=Penicillium canariense TaxID=189055 RepID=A0A9W9HQW0_9EURO|nr:uncharacterized protein N7482_009643 [Penicillium canariense]KAJ5153165.1 hypothetical protein N7482_009643 [Penicillium canariense]